MKLGFSQEILEKHPNIKFHQNPFSKSRVVPFGRKDGRRDRPEEVISRFSQFCERPFKSSHDQITMTESVQRAEKNHETL
jgi:hypothetical protein